MNKRATIGGSMESATVLPDQVVSIHIRVPIEQVWAEITKVGRVQRAVFDTVLETELKPGSRLRYYNPDHTRVFVVGEVVEVDPPRAFVHTYRFTTWRKGPATLVRWELEEEAGGCRVTITHSGWTPEHDAPEKTGKGWRDILELLKHLLETGVLPRRARVMFRLMGWLAFALPRSTRVANVDRLASEDER